MRIHIGLIVLVGVLVYGNSLSGPLVFDDEISILKNAQIRQLVPPSGLLSGPLSPTPDTPVAGRPLVNLTFAMNYAVGGLDVTGYHAVNVTLHVLSALVIYGLVRRTLRLPRMGGALADHADHVALAAALIWVVHPLASETVDYLTQRSEGLMALCFLATLYASVRAATADRATGWTLAAVVACAAGMTAKESMVTAPVIVILFDRVFLYPTWRHAWAARMRLWGGLALGWVVLAALMLQVPRTTVGFSAGVSAWTYFLNQLQMIATYAGLAVWPQALALDYGLPRQLGVGDVLVPGLLVVLLGVVTLVALWKRPPLGFLGAWCFITLAPTSSIVPIATEVGAERRMYLPLVALAVLAALLLWRLMAPRQGGGRGGGHWRMYWAAVSIVCVLLGARTVLRNREFASGLTLAQTNVDRRPNGRARFQLARALVEAQQHGRAMEEFKRAASDYPNAHFALATEMLAGGRAAEAVSEAEAFLRLVPKSPAANAAHDLLGSALALQGQVSAAAEHFELLTRATPRDPAPFVRLGEMRLRQRRFDEAARASRAAIALRPGDAAIYKQLGLSLSAAGRADEAIDAFFRGVQLQPNDISLLNFFGRALAARGNYVDAVVPMRRLVELAPSDVQGRQNLAIMERMAAAQAAQIQQAQSASR